VNKHDRRIGQRLDQARLGVAWMRAGSTTGQPTWVRPIAG
jgi:hypothetical protein